MFAIRYSSHEGRQKPLQSREFLRYTGVTLLAIALEMGLFLLLNRALPGGTALAYLLSSGFANALSFTLNRRTTFRASNNLIWAVGLYVLYTLGVLAVQTLLGPGLQGALETRLPAGGAAALAKGLLMLGNFLLSYPMNKYVIMRVG